MYVISCLDPQLQEDQPAQCTPQELVEPRLGNLESELIIQGVCRCGEDVLGMREQSDQPTLVEWTRAAAFDAGPIQLKHEVEHRLDSHQHEENGQDLRHDQIKRGDLDLPT